ncbi:cysteine desulfurase/sulfurtransferase TusA family protein [Streptacidiphilus rugosus]|uniref:cysteine desulfurase/sulfurtransferase TusA family protein n=1 Tax=Streptacidiphilus rugosus TaxID=405783 RepID=UPI00055B600B|nr:cysteine desulfurase/sulfurtransferase TusA family protein [Streptacidiphilus rugosus]
MPNFDVASTAPLHPLARQALLSALDEGWADPARLYRDARHARMLLDAARESVASDLGVRADELSFTASGTQANHLAVLGLLAGNHRKGRHLVHSAVEHSSVLHAAERHEADGGAVTSVPVDASGRIRPDALQEAVATAGTALACLQSANHEVGTVQPVTEAAELCAAAGVPLFVDAAQSAAWSRVEGPWSALAASAHKWGGPAGVGVLAVRKGVRYRPPFPADEREGGRVPGFVNVPSIVAAAVALRAAREDAAAADARLRPLVDLLRDRVPALVPDVAVLGDAERRLPHLLTFSCLYVDGESLLGALDRAGFAVSSGSSCTSSTLTPSHVLAAMGALTEGNVRVSLGRDATREQVEEFLAVLPEAVASVRAQLTPATTESPSKEVTVVDVLGKLCPIPVIELARQFPAVPVDGVIAVLSDDEAAAIDIPAWCHMRSQAYEGQAPAADYLPGATGTAYLVRRLS